MPREALRRGVIWIVRARLYMPQVDKATFFPIVFWTFTLYIAGFLLLNTTSMFTFLSSLKLNSKHASVKYGTALVSGRLVSNLLFFPLISL